MNRFIKTLFLAVLFGAPLSGHTHQSSDSFLIVDTSAGDTVSINWAIALRDLEVEPGIDLNDDALVTRAEFESRKMQIADYALSRLDFGYNDADCRITTRDIRADKRAGQPVAIIDAVASCRSTDQLALSYGLFFDFDSSHRGLARLITASDQHSFVFSPTRTRTIISPDEMPTGSLTGFVLSGIHHILIGYDHIAFLLLLLLPAALRRNEGRWVPVGRKSRVIVDVVGIVTAFTLAHSLTLGLAATGLINLPVQLAEVLIALSVVAAALANFAPTTMRQRQGLAFGFGLIHGFGFASVFGELGTAASSLLPVLFAFNIGVELGQLAIVALLLPIIMLLSRKHLYSKVGLPMASVSAVILGFVWLLERV